MKELGRPVRDGGGQLPAWSGPRAAEAIQERPADLETVYVSDQAVLVGEHRKVDPVAGVELGQGSRDVGLDRALGQVQ